MSNKLKALPKKITKEIRKILEGCRDGKLNHNQSVVHCGTKHCIAGWKAVLDARKVVGGCVLTASFPKDDVLPDVVDGCDLYAFTKKDEYVDAGNDWIYAERQWCLTDTEAYGLFSASATFDKQFELLEALERGERLV